MNEIFIGLIIGAASGIVAALCGVGGGIIMVPAFVLCLRFPQKTAVATSLAAMILTVAAATWKNHGNDLVNWRVAMATTAAASLVAWFTADYLQQLSNTTLTRIFAVLLISMGVRMLFQK